MSYEVPFKLHFGHISMIFGNIFSLNTFFSVIFWEKGEYQINLQTKTDGSDGGHNVGQ